MPLLYVLWSVALLTVIATAVAATGSVSYRLSHNAAEVARHEALAEAALSRAVLALLDARPDRRWRADAAPRRFTFDGAEISISIQDELGRIDLNNADALLAGLFREVGGAGDEAEALVDRVTDWRDRDDLRRPHGAELAEYRAAGREPGPRNGPFESVEELKLVLGVTPEMFRRVEPYLTVYSGRAMIDPRLAPAGLRKAFRFGPGEGLAHAEAFGARPAEPITPLAGRAFLIRMDFSSISPSFAREAVIRLTGDPVKPYWLLHWRTGAPPMD